jgi:hypothetical protein
MGIDFAALGTGMEIRQALDFAACGMDIRQALDWHPHPRRRTAMGAVAVMRARVEELETRLNTARRTAWVAVPVEAGPRLRPGTRWCAKDGTLMAGADTEHFRDDEARGLEMEAGPDFGVCLQKPGPRTARSRCCAGRPPTHWTS